MNDLFQDFRGGIGFLVMGPPKVGKSTFAGSAAEAGAKVKLLSLKPREANSWKYRQHGIHETAELFHDPAWKPMLSKYEASGFLDFYRRLDELAEDEEHDVVVVDPFTDVVYLAAHEILKKENASTPQDMSNPMGFYGDMKHLLHEVTKSIVALQHAPSPKHVIVIAHTQPAREEDLKGKPVADSRAKGVEYMGDVLPMIEGGYRREIASEFDVVLFAGVEYEFNQKTRQREENYVVQVRANPERHASIALAPRLAEASLPNDFGTVLDKIREATSES